MKTLRNKTWVLLGILFIFASCSKKLSPSTELIVGIEKEPRSHHPVFGTDALSEWVNDFLFDSLVRIGEDLAVHPHLALKWENLTESKYRFTLRENIVFHNGEKCTCEDIVQTINRYKADDSPYALVYSRIKEFKCVTPTTLDIELTEPFAGFLVDLTVIKILPRSQYQGISSQMENPIGTGPYKVETYKGEKIRFVKNNQYWGDKTEIPSVTFRVIQDPQTRILALKKKEVDVLLNNLDPSQLESLKDTPEIGILRSEGITYQYLSFNMEYKPLMDKRVRHALSYAINRDEIIEQKLKGYAVKASGVLSPLNPYYEPNVPSFQYDPEKAQRLLKEAGYSDMNPLSLEYKVSTDPLAVSIALIIKDYWAKVGVITEIKSYEFATFYDDIKKGNFQVHSLRRVGVTEPQILFDLFNSSQFAPQGQNRGHYKSYEVDELTKKAAVTIDMKQRKTLYSRVQKLIAEEAPYISLWFNSNTVAYQKDRISDLKPWPNGSYLCLLKVKKN